MRSRLIPIKWDSAVLSLTPKWCPQCETQIREIQLFYDRNIDGFHLFCGHCKRLLKSFTSAFLQELRDLGPKAPV